MVKHRLIYLLTGCQPTSWYATPDASCYASLRSTRAADGALAREASAK